jgi:hypothetical protein
MNLDVHVAFTKRAESQINRMAAAVATLSEFAMPSMGIAIANCRECKRHFREPYPSSSGQVGFRKLNDLGDLMLTPRTLVSPLIVAGPVGKDVY